MINIKTFNADSLVIDVMDVSRIEARRIFDVDPPKNGYRELQVIDDTGRGITLRLYSDDVEKLKIKEETMRKTEKTKCQTCGNDEGSPRVDNGLLCGVHCDGCFEKMVRECRSRSW